MRFLSWLRERNGDRSSKSARPVRSKSRPARRVRLGVEALEDRCVPSTVTVLNNQDSGIDSLRADIATAQNGDTIVFASSLAGQTITLTSGELLVNKNLTIQGLGASQLTISGDNLSRVFEVANGKKGPTQFALSGLTISNGVGVAAAGSSKSTDGSGGGILVDAGAALTVNNSTLSGNKANIGGGIFNSTGTVMVTGCILSSNSALNGDGGGIRNGGGTLTVTGSTLSGNTAKNSGGGIFSQGTLTVSGSTLSSNSSHNGGGIFFGGIGTAMVSDSTLTGNTATYAGFYRLAALFRAGYFDDRHQRLRIVSC